MRKRLFALIATFIIVLCLMIPVFASDYSQDSITNSSVIVLPYLDEYSVYHEFVFHNDGFDTPPFIGKTIYSIDKTIKYTWYAPTSIPVGGVDGTVGFGSVKVEAYGNTSNISYVTPNSTVVGTPGHPSSQNAFFHVSVSGLKVNLGVSTYLYTGLQLSTYEPIPWVGLRLQSQVGVHEDFYDEGYQAGYEYMRDQLYDEIDQSYQDGFDSGYQQAFLEGDLSDMFGSGINGFFSGIGNVIQPFLSLGIGGLTVGTFVGLGMLILGVILIVKLIKG